MKSPYILTTTSQNVTIDYRCHLDSFKSVLLSQHQDPELSKITSMLLSPDSNNNSVTNHYCLVKNVLFYRRSQTSDQWLVCIPADRINELIMNVHQHFGHVGPKKCILAIRDFCYFKSFQKRIRTTVRTCDLCQRAKPSTTRTEGEMKSILADVPLECVLVDIYGPLPSGWNQTKYIFVVLDNFSRFVRLYPIKKATVVVVTNRMINDYIGMYGVPRCIVSDHGVQFTSRIWQTRLSATGVPPTMTTVYHPQSNPAERVMRELGRMFWTYCSDHHTEWPKYINYVEWVLNNTTSYRIYPTRIVLYG